ncbi:MAG TPA: methyltransferase domain-containing protein [Planctomycetota bacterium]|nr:methyltransferase domain-containing protein [Planctomycetota bacterium]
MTLSAEEWSARYVSGDSPWDLGAPHPELVMRIAEGLVPADAAHRRALVPGCGRGHDALALARAGWLVTAIDFVDPTAGELGRELEALGGRLLIENALEHSPDRACDLFFEHTFFCAIDPSLRGRWGELVRRSLAPGGSLCALVFPVGKPASDGGPPYGMTPADMVSALGEPTAIAVDEPVRQGIARRSWPERWAVLRRAK